MNANERVEMHGRKAMRHYDDMTADFYLAIWHPRYIHFGLFEEDEIPEDGAITGGPENLTAGLERMIEETVAPAGVGADHHVVDAGCGIGGVAHYLAETRGCRVTGVNLNEGQLEIAEERTKEARLGHLIDYKYGDCSRELPFESDSIDIVVNIESACHFADRGQFLREVRRILRPGGRVAGMDWLTTDNATAEQRELYVEPFCDQWALGGLESLSSYAERLRDSDLTVLECTGFDGRDIGNLRLVEYYSRTLKGLSFIGLLPARYRPVMRSFRALELIWQHRCFETGRYCAIKPAGG